MIEMRKTLTIKEEILKYKLGESAIKNIVMFIMLEFFQNLEHRDGYIYSKVSYEGKFYTVVFYDIRQINSVLYKLANNFVS